MHKRMSEIVREAISRYHGGKKRKVDYFSFVGAGRGPRKGRTSERTEEVLREVLKSSS